MLKNRLIFISSLAVALGGFLFGFDTVVISGANEPIKELWGTSGWFHGMFIMSMALWGTVLGAIFGGIPTDRWGRKKTLIWIGILFFVSAVGSALASDPYMFSFFRFIGGVGVGASSVAAPIYISEISSPKNRGRLVALYQFNLVLGILIAFISNYLLSGFGGANDWRWMLGVEAVPALLYILFILRVPLSPRWLFVHERREEEAKLVVQRLYPAEEAEEVFAEITRDDEEHKHHKTESLWNKKYRKPLTLAFLIALFNQVSGINFVLYYAPVILEEGGFASSESLFSSISIGGINLLFTLVGMALIDRAGRKQLMYIGSAGYVLSLGLISYGFYTGASPTFILVFILMFIASHAVGQGAIIWVFISEIFPNQVRAKGQAWGTGTHWVMAAIITLVGEVIIDAFPAGAIFAFFAACMVAQGLFTHFMMPETKGKALEAIDYEAE